MNPLIPLAGIIAAVLARRAIRRTDGTTSTGARAWERWREVIMRVPSPIPPPVMALRIARESAGNPRAYVGGRVTGGGEAGLTQVYVPYSPTERSGARGADSDPLDPLGAVWATQWVADRTRRMLQRDLPGWGKDVPSDSDVRRWIVLLEAEHSIGYGAIGRIMARRTATRDPIRALELERSDPRAIGRMSADLVRRRIERLLAIPDRAAAIGDLPTRIDPLPPRPADVPRFSVTVMRTVDRRFT